MLAAAGVAITALTFAGCGANDRGSAAQDAPESVTSAAPEAQARRIVEIRYPSIRVWVSKYAQQWGTTPRVRWTAERRTDDRWIARVQITGGTGQQASGSWEVRAPLGSNPDPDQVRAAVENETPPKPLDPGGRTLSTAPGSQPPLTAAEQRGPVAIVGTVGLVDADAGTVTIDAAPEQSGAASSRDLAVRRGARTPRFGRREHRHHPPRNRDHVHALHRRERAAVDPQGVHRKRRPTNRPLHLHMVD